VTVAATEALENDCLTCQVVMPSLPLKYQGGSSSGLSSIEAGERSNTSFTCTGQQPGERSNQGAAPLSNQGAAPLITH
jgi:hypothetical protein